MISFFPLSLYSVDRHFPSITWTTFKVYTPLRKTEWDDVKEITSRRTSSMRFKWENSLRTISDMSSEGWSMLQCSTLHFIISFSSTMKFEVKQSKQMNNWLNSGKIAACCSWERNLLLEQLCRSSFEGVWLIFLKSKLGVSCTQWALSSVRRLRLSRLELSRHLWSRHVSEELYERIIISHLTLSESAFASRISKSHQD